MICLVFVATTERRKWWWPWEWEQLVATRGAAPLIGMGKEGGGTREIEAGHYLAADYVPTFEALKVEIKGSN